jgi:hypothetical protein
MATAQSYIAAISMILPFEMRKRSKPIATYGLPVGGFPNNGPVFVPLFVHLISTLSPLAKYHDEIVKSISVYP